MKAVILAAGMGARIRAHHTLPKGFIKVGEESIIVESLRHLKRYGIEHILLVTGYGEEHYLELARQTGLFTTIKNTCYDGMGSLYSLYCAREWIDDHCLLLESDLLYEARALSAVGNAPDSEVILISGMTHSHDEVYVEAQNTRLVNMSKNRKVLTPERLAGEFVGISKLSLSAYRHLMQQVEKNDTLLQKAHYEEGLVLLAKTHPIVCITIPDLLWCEIDDIHHWHRAKSLYQKIQMAYTLS